MADYFITKNPSETKKLAQDLAHRILKLPEQKRAFAIGLIGELGAGKTCFLQGFAQGLGIKEKILSPTFIIFRRLKIRKEIKFKNLYHFDCYRIQNPKEILDLGFRKIISEPGNVIALEWPEKIRKILPKKKLSIKFAVIDEKKRKITIKGGKALGYN